MTLSRALLLLGLLLVIGALVRVVLDRRRKRRALADRLDAVTEGVTLLTPEELARRERTTYPRPADDDLRPYEPPPISQRMTPRTPVEPPRRPDDVTPAPGVYSAGQFDGFGAPLSDDSIKTTPTPEPYSPPPTPSWDPAPSPSPSPSSYGGGYSGGSDSGSSGGGSDSGGGGGGGGGE